MQEEHRRESEHGEEQCVAIGSRAVQAHQHYEYQEMYRGQQRGEQHRIRGFATMPAKRKNVGGKNAMYASTSQVCRCYAIPLAVGRATVRMPL